MTLRFSPILFAIVLATVAKPSLANEIPYSETMLRSLVEVCVRENPKGIFVPFAKETPSEKALTDILGEYQLVVKKSIDRAKQTRLEQEQAIEASISQRLVQLKEKLKDQQALKQELAKVREVIMAGAVKGEKLTPEQLESLSAAAKDLEMLSQDPKHAEVMAQTTKAEMLTAVRTRETAFITEATKGLAKINRCGCAVGRIQQHYSAEELGDRIKLEVTGEGGIFKDVKDSYKQCPKSMF